MIFHGRRGERSYLVMYGHVRFVFGPVLSCMRYGYMWLWTVLYGHVWFLWSCKVYGGEYRKIWNTGKTRLGQTLIRLKVVIKSNWALFEAKNLFEPNFLVNLNLFHQNLFLTPIFLDSKFLLDHNIFLEGPKKNFCIPKIVSLKNLGWKFSSSKNLVKKKNVGPNYFGYNRF